MTDEFNPFASPQADMSGTLGAAWLQEGPRSLRRTGIGLSLVFYGIVVMLFAILAFLGTMSAAAIAGGVVGGVSTVLVLLAVLVGALLLCVGPLVCLAVPSETGAQKLIVGSVVLQSANLVFAIASLLEPFLPGSLPRAVILSLPLIGLAGQVLFVLFMKRLAEYVGRPDLAALARGVMLRGTAMVALGGLALAGKAADVRIADPVLAVVVLGLWVVVIRWAGLVNHLRRVLLRT
jgi:hypothetical protein